VSAGDWIGADLGTRTVRYDERDAILYALAVGAGATDLDLVWEERLRVLPTFALTLAQWAPDVLANQDAWDETTAVHGSQRLRVFEPLPRSGQVVMSARVAQVWDKGSAAVFDIEVATDFFVATWSIFAPGRGGFGGERGPSAPPVADAAPEIETELRTFDSQAVLYRLTGDRHAIHVDPVAAAVIGAPGPIMHGLCTLAAASLRLAGAVGAHPADLVELAGRFAAPVLPGQTLRVLASRRDGGLDFTASHYDTPVLTAGRARFAGEERR
jgi:acyl dehydratase